MSEMLPNLFDQCEAAAELAALQANPYLPDRPKQPVSKMTPAIKRKFCEALAQGASPTRAAKALGVARSTVYYQRSVDPDFAEAWAEALEQAADRYEDALDELALKTKNVGAVIFQLKNRRPEKWRDRHDVQVDRRTLNVTVAAPQEALPGILARLAERSRDGSATDAAQEAGNGG